MHTIISMMKACGYKVDDGGMCYGIAWTQAYFNKSGELGRFNELISVIHKCKNTSDQENTNQTVREAIENILKTSSHNSLMYDDPIDYFAILFDNIIAHHDNTTNDFTTETGQNGEKAE